MAVDQQDGVLSLLLSTPANAPVGLYRLTLEASTGYQGSSFVLGHFTLLFNTWCPGELSSLWRGDRGSWAGLDHPWAPRTVAGGEWGRRWREGPSGQSHAPASQEPCRVLLPASHHTGRDRHLEAKCLARGHTAAKRPHPTSEAHVFPEPCDLGVQVSGVHNPSQEWGAQGNARGHGSMPGSGSWALFEISPDWLGEGKLRETEAEGGRKRWAGAVR